MLQWLYTAWSKIIGGSETMDSSLDHRWMCEKMVGAYDIKTIFWRENLCSTDMNPRK